MSEKNTLRPTTFLMATLAQLALLSFVNVIIHVTVVAFCRQIFLIQMATVTGRAGQFGVFALE